MTNATSRLSAAALMLRNKESTRTHRVAITPTARPDLTQEQLAALRNTSKKVKIQAFAGTGKTTLLKEFAKQAHQANGLYLAYNTSIANDARKSFPENVTCLTHNAMALRQLAKIEPAWGDVSRSKLANLETQHITQFKKSGLNQEWILQCIAEFIKSTDPEISESHFPLAEVLFLENGNATPNISAHIHAAKVVWGQMSDATNATPMPHEGYLKLWSMKDRQLQYDYVLIDESQDSNPAFLKGMQKQKCRQIFVGDEHQGIYAFRGAVNALRTLKDCDELALTLTHRFGLSIAHLANEIIRNKNCSVFIKPSPNTPDTTVVYGSAPFGTQPLYLARTNSGLFDKALNLAENGKSFKLTGNHARLHFDDLEELLRLAQGAPSIYSAHKDLDGLIEAANKTGKNELAMRCRLIKKHGNALPDKLAAINAKARPQTTQEENIPTLSTIHQAKGLEADWVELLSDFPNSPCINATQQTELSTENIEEANILYVGLTRARSGLAINEGPVNAWAQNNRWIPTKKEDEVNLF